MCSEDPKRLKGVLQDINRRHKFNASSDSFKCLEDPFLFRLKDGSYHMIMHNQVGDFSGAHAFSVDGIEWDLAKTPAYTLEVNYTHGKKVRLQRREEPKLLFEGGHATHLFNAVCARGGKCGEVLATPFLEPIELWQ